MPQLTAQIAANADDGWIIQPNSYFNTGNVVVFGENFGVFFRFDNIALTNAETINSARLVVEASSDRSTANCHVTIAAVDEDDPTAPTSASDYNNRTRTTASVNWTTIPSGR